LDYDDTASHCEPDYSIEEIPFMSDFETHFFGVLSMVEAVYAKGPRVTATEIFERFTSNQNDVNSPWVARDPSELPHLLLFARRCLQCAESYPGEPCMRVVWKDVPGYEYGECDVLMDGTMELPTSHFVLGSLDIPVSIQFDVEDRPALIMRGENGLRSLSLRFSCMYWTSQTFVTQPCI
jgi:hypothetical protein